MVNDYRYCSHPDCRSRKGLYKFRIPSRWGWEPKWYCGDHFEYGVDLKESETKRIFPDGKIVFWANLNRSYNRVIQGFRITKATRDKVYNRDGNRCLKCGETDVNKLSLDHVKPKSKGGTNELDNLQTLCKKCNEAKGSDTIDYRGGFPHDFPIVETVVAVYPNDFPDFPPVEKSIRDYVRLN